MIIAALLQKDISDRIQDLRLELYDKGYNLNAPEIDWEPHTTLNRIEYDQSDETMTEVYSEITKVSENTGVIKTSQFNLVNEPENENISWIAITLFSQELLNHSQKFEKILQAYEIDLTKEYRTRIAALRKSKHESVVDDTKCIADHINLINNCKIELSGDAYNRFQSILPVELIYDRLVIGEDGKYLHTINL